MVRFMCRACDMELLRQELCQLRPGRELKVRVEGQLVFNSAFQVLNAALADFGLAYVPEDVAQPYLAKGRLKRVLRDWCPPWPGYHLWSAGPDPNRR